MRLENSANQNFPKKSQKITEILGKISYTEMNDIAKVKSPQHYH